VPDRIPGVLPPWLKMPGWNAASTPGIVAVAVPVLHSQFSAASACGDSAAEGDVARPLVGVGEHDEEQRRGIRRAVIGAKGSSFRLASSRTGFVGIFPFFLFASSSVACTADSVRKHRARIPGSANAFHRDDERVPRTGSRTMGSGGGYEHATLTVYPPCAAHRCPPLPGARSRKVGDW